MQKNDETSHNFQSDIYCKLLSLYKTEFIDECAEIVNQKETNFLRRFFNKMNLIIQNEYGHEVFDDVLFAKTVKAVERKVYESLYMSMKNSCSSTLSKGNNKKKIEGLYLTNFRSHCPRNLIPIHSCKGKFIQANDSKGKPLYVICINCKQCYTESSILMHCSCCSINFYSAIVSNLDRQLLPATWEKYHCNAVINEQMRCIRCQDLFYIKNNALFCKNCKYTTNPLDVVWKCVVCRKEFKSYAKVYNPLEFKMIKLTVRNALLYKILIKPTELPCGCSDDPLSLNFVHKSQCKGIPYYGEYNGKDMIICSVCKATASYNKFTWTCAICQKTFKTKSIKIFLKEDDNLLLSEITQQIEKKVNKDKLFLSSEYQKLSLKSNDDGFPLESKHDQRYTDINNDTQNITTITNNNNIKKSAVKSIDKPRDSSRQRNFSINLRERSGSKKKESISALKKDEDNDDNEIPYYAQNQHHNGKRNEKQETSVDHSLSKNHYSQQRNVAIDNDTNPPSNNNINQMQDQAQPFFKSHYKNYQKYIPQKSINLGESLNKGELSPTSDSNRLSNAFSLTAGHFNRFRSNHIDRNYSNDSRKNPFKLINKENISQKEELMGYNKQLSKKSYNKLDYSAEPIPNIQLQSKHNEISIEDNKNEDVHIVKNLEQALNAQFNNDKNQLVKSSLNNIKVDTTKHINIDSLDDDNEIEKNAELNTINIDDYTIITQLGQGTFGKIYLVEDKEQKIYSLKKIVLTEELDIEMILKEYQLVHYLQHDNIIKIIGYCQSKLDFSSFVIYILMEVGLGDWEKEIKNHLDKQLYYTEKEIISILSQLVSALTFLQKKKVSHRDIKPGNVLVFKNGIYKIADFGEAKKVTQTQQNKQVNTLRGTELYMSPLLFNGIKTNQLDIKHNLYKSDVFSLGLCIVYSMALTNSFIYEIRKMVDSNNIRRYLTKIFSKRYSQKLLDLIGCMLEINELNRCDFIELRAKIKEAFVQELQNLK